MKIWIINHYALPLDAAGGTRHYYFARQLIERGHEVVIVAANYNHITHAYVPNNKPGEIDNTHPVPFIWIPVPAYKGNTIARFWNMLVFSKRLLNKKFLNRESPPDIIIGSSPHLFAALGAEFLAKRLKKPFFLEIRDLWPETLVDLGRFTNKHPLIMLMKKVERYLYRRADKIITLLPTAYQYLTQCGVAPENITWLPNAIDTDVVPQEYKLPENQDQFVVLYAGAHGVANDLDTLLDAAKLLSTMSLNKPISIWLIGDGPAKNALQQRALTEKITNVKFIDAVAKTEIYSVLNQANAFILLLKKSPVFRWGISPNKLFDYLIMSRPVIFGVETSHNPVLEHQAGISISPGDPVALANAIRDLSLMSDAERKVMGDRGKQYVLENHHIKKLTDKLEKLMIEVVEETS